MTTADPRNPYAPDSRVQKGGSFLCHVSYCESYRPSAKMAAPPDTGMSHVGFRCVKAPDSLVGGLLAALKDYPPSQKPASFNLDRIFEEFLSQPGTH